MSKNIELLVKKDKIMSEENYMENYDIEVDEVRDKIDNALDDMSLEDLNRVKEAITDLGFDMSVEDKGNEAVGIFKDMSKVVDEFFKPFGEPIKSEK